MQQRHRHLIGNIPRLSHLTRIYGILEKLEFLSFSRRQLDQLWISNMTYFISITENHHYFLSNTRSIRARVLSSIAWWGSLSKIPSILRMLRSKIHSKNNFGSAENRTRDSWVWRAAPLFKLVNTLLSDNFFSIQLIPECANSKQAWASGCHEERLGGGGWYWTRDLLVTRQLQCHRDKSLSFAPIFTSSAKIWNWLLFLSDETHHVQLLNDLVCRSEANLALKLKC